MLNIALVCGGLLVFFAAVQLVSLLIFSRVVDQQRWPLPDDTECPNVCVMLCLRGADPFLHRCIEGLLGQSYPTDRLKIRVIVDSEQDPAWPVIHKIVEGHSSGIQVQIETLDAPLESCSLVNSSIVQFVTRLDESVECIAILDADVIAHPNWLKNLVSPIVNDDYAVAAGNRWYMPADVTWGALVRYVWNVGAVVQMYFNSYSWGGSIAVRKDLIDDSELVECWKKAFAFDTTFHDEVNRQGKQIAFVPENIMTNRENCDLAGFFPWVQRQLLLSRLYHPQWLFILFHGMITSFLIFGGFALLLASMVIGSGAASACLAGGIGLFWLSTVIGMWRLEKVVCDVVNERGEDSNWLSFGSKIKLFLAMPLTQLVYMAALIQTVRIRETSWRGIDYRIGGPYDIEMHEYQTYQAGTSAMGSDELASI